MTADLRRQAEQWLAEPHPDWTATEIIRDLLALVDDLEQQIGKLTAERETERGTAFCSFCGWSFEYVVGTPDQDVAQVYLAKHVTNCKSHPLVKRAEQAEATLTAQAPYLQHKDDCDSHRCAICKYGSCREDAIHRHGHGVHYFEPRSCTCGLAEVLRLPPADAEARRQHEHEKEKGTDHARR